MGAYAKRQVRAAFEAGAPARNHSGDARRSPVVGIGNQALMRRTTATSSGRLGNQARLRLLASDKPLQASLEVGPIDDPMEREADRVADQVMRSPEPALAFDEAHARVQRACAECEEEAMMRMPAGTGAATGQAAPPIVHDVLASPGQPLDAASRAFFEPRFGRDFGDVRIHTGGRAEESARSVGAIAYTVGNDIVFGAGRHVPGTTDGRRLLAHELTHTVQQDHAAPRRIERTAAPEIQGAAGLSIQRVNECAGKSKSQCMGGCVPADGLGTGFCAWSGTIKNGCVCYRRDQPMLDAVKQALFDALIAALILAGIALTAAAIAAIIACLSGPCEVAALIGALGYAGAMIVLGILGIKGGGGAGASAETAPSESAGGSNGEPAEASPA